MKRLEGRSGGSEKSRHEMSTARRIAVSVKKGACLAATTAIMLAAFLASPEHILKNKAPIPLAFTMR